MQSYISSIVCDFRAWASSPFVGLGSHCSSDRRAVGLDQMINPAACGCIFVVVGECVCELCYGGPWPGGNPSTISKRNSFNALTAKLHPRNVNRLQRMNPFPLPMTYVYVVRNGTGRKNVITLSLLRRSPKAVRRACGTVSRQLSVCVVVSLRFSAVSPMSLKTTAQYASLNKMNAEPFAHSEIQR